MSDFENGDVVYASYRPLRYGKVVAIEDRERKGRSYTYCHVHWKDGEETWEWEIHLRSLSKLVEDLTRKLNTHTQNLRKANEL